MSGIFILLWKEKSDLPNEYAGAVLEAKTEENAKKEAEQAIANVESAGLERTKWTLVKVVEQF